MTRLQKLICGVLAVACCVTLLFLEGFKLGMSLIIVSGFTAFVWYCGTELATAIKNVFLYRLFVVLGLITTVVVIHSVFNETAPITVKVTFTLFFIAMGFAVFVALAWLLEWLFEWATKDESTIKDDSKENL